MRLSFLMFFLLSFALYGRSLRLKVEGMDCPLCGAKVEEALKDIKEIKDFKIDIEDQILTLELLPKSSLTKEQIIKKLSKKGFKSSSF